MGIGETMSSVFRSPKGSAFFSFVIGLGVAILLFHRPQKERVVSSVAPKEIERVIVSQNGKCYRFRVEDASCPVASSTA